MKKIMKGDFVVLESGSTSFSVGELIVVEGLECLRYLPKRREAWHARCDGREVLMKLFVPHAKQERDACREWSRGVELFSMGHDVSVPLFYARSEEGELCVAYEFIADGVLLGELLRGRDRAVYLKMLMAQHAAWHDSGCVQADNHLGNYMVSDGRMVVLDSGSVRVGVEIDLQGRVANLAMLGSQIPLPTQECFMRAVADDYLERSKSRFDKAGFLDCLEREVRKAIIKKRKKYQKKTRRSCSEFEVTKSSAVWRYVRRDLPDSVVSMLSEDLDRYFVGASLLKAGNTCTVAEVVVGGESYILKRYNRKSLGYRLLRMWMRPRALKSWTSGHVLSLFGVQTPRPLACLLFKKGMLNDRAYLLMEKVSGVPLDDVTLEQATRCQPDLARQVSERWRELGVLQMTHGDMKAANLIVSEEGILTLIDLDGMKYHSSCGCRERSQRKDIARFAKNWESKPELAKLFQDVAREGS